VYLSASHPSLSLLPSLLCLTLFFSISLSLSQHTQLVTLSFFHTHSLTRPLTHFLSLSLSHTHTHTQSTHAVTRNIKHIYSECLRGHGMVCTDST
jgi:hypothetical protein